MEKSRLNFANSFAQSIFELYLIRTNVKQFPNFMESLSRGQNNQSWQVRIMR